MNTQHHPQDSNSSVNSSATHQYSTTPHPRCRRIRSKITPQQKSYLDAIYVKLKKPDFETRRTIAENLDWPERSVRIWFQNMRQKDSTRLKAGLYLPHTDFDEDAPTVIHDASHVLSSAAHITSEINADDYAETSDGHENQMLNQAIAVDAQIKEANEQKILTSSAAAALIQVWEHQHTRKSQASTRHEEGARPETTVSCSNPYAISTTLMPCEYSMQAQPTNSGLQLNTDDEYAPNSTWNIFQSSQIPLCTPAAHQKCLPPELLMVTDDFELKSPCDPSTAMNLQPHDYNFYSSAKTMLDPSNHASQCVDTGLSNVDCANRSCLTCSK